VWMQRHDCSCHDRTCAVQQLSAGQLPAMYQLYVPHAAALWYGRKSAAAVIVTL
jgi:hypothetical protein